MAQDFILTCEMKKEGGGYSSWCPELDIASQGETEEESRKNLQEAVELYIETIIQNEDINELLSKICLIKEEFIALV